MPTPYIPSVTVSPVQSDLNAPFYSQLSKVLGHISNIAATDVAFNNKLKSELRDQSIKTNTIDKVNQLKTEAEMNPDAAEGLSTYTKKFIDFRNTYLSSLSGSDKELADNYITHSGFTASLGLQKRAYQQNVNIATATGLESYSKQTNQMAASLYAGDAESVKEGAAIFASNTQSIDKLQSTGSITPTQAANMHSQLNYSFATNHIYGSYNQARQADAEANAGGKDAGNRKQWKESFGKNVQPYLKQGLIPTEALKTIRNNIKALDNWDDQGNKINQYTADKLYKNVIYQAKNGIDIDPGSINQLQATNPNKYADIQHQIQLGQTEHSIVKKSTSGTIGEMEEERDALNNAASKSKSYDENKMLNDASVRVDSAIKQFGKSGDPVAAVEDSDITKQSIENAKMSAEYKEAGLEKDPEKRASDLNQILMQSRMDSIKKQLHAKGVSDQDVSVLSKSEVNAITQHVLTLPAEQQADAAQLAVSSFPKEFQPIIRRQLFKTLPVSSSYVLRVMDDPDNQKYTKYLTNALAWTSKDYSGTLDSLKLTEMAVTNSVINSKSNQKHNAVISQYPGNWASDNNQFNHLQGLLTVSLLASKKETHVDDAAKLAGEILSSGIDHDSFNKMHYSYPKNVTLISKQNGQIVHKEVPFENSKFKNAMSFTQQKMVSNENLDSINLPPNIRNQFPANMKLEKIKKMMVETSGFIPNENGSGVIMVTQDGSPITQSKNNLPINIEYKDIVDSTSDINKEMVGYKPSMPWYEYPLLPAEGYLAIGKAIIKSPFVVGKAISKL